MEGIIIHQAHGPSHQSSLYKGNQLLPLPLTNITTFLKNFTTSPSKKENPTMARKRNKNNLQLPLHVHPHNPPPLSDSWFHCSCYRFLIFLIALVLIFGFIVLYPLLPSLKVHLHTYNIYMQRDIFP